MKLNLELKLIGAQLVLTFIAVYAVGAAAMNGSGEWLPGEARAGW